MSSMAIISKSWLLFLSTLVGDYWLFSVIEKGQNKQLIIDYNSNGLLKNFFIQYKIIILSALTLGKKFAYIGYNLELS